MIATERLINFTVWVQEHTDGSISYAMWSEGGKEIQSKYGIGLFEAWQSIGIEVLECKNDTFAGRRKDVDAAELFRVNYPVAHDIWMRLQSAADRVKLGLQFADKIVKNTAEWLEGRK